MVCKVCNYDAYIKFCRFGSHYCNYHTYLSFCKCDCSHDIDEGQIDNTEFYKKWKTLSPAEKLETYSKDKLMVLCRNKGLKIRNTVKKHEVINILKDLVVASDFPIISKRLKDKLIS